MTKQTCGPLYKEALEKYAGNDPEKIRLFAAGFVSGQAEKVYLGACRAAMFRPSAERHEMLLKVVHEVALRYGLFVLEYADEIWLCVADACSSICALSRYKANSPLWHRLRAGICGVPKDDVDEMFHLRKGFGERCD